MPKLTLSMIVKNEENDLPGCLESVKNIADEIVIIDTGSSDSTIKIAEKYGAKVYHFKWVDDFSAARNYALSKSAGSWILYLDADERLEKKSAAELQAIIVSDKNLGIYCNVNSINEKGGESSQMKYLRLFRNLPGISFSGKVHEQIEKSLVESGCELVDSGIEITHLGYNLDRAGIAEKAERNFNLLAGQYKLNPDSYTAFQLGQTLIMLERKTEAHKYFSEAVKSADLEIHHRAQAYRYLAAIELENNNLKRAEEFIEKGLELNDEMPMLCIVAASVYQRSGKNEKASFFCRRAFDQNRKLLQSEKKSYFDIMANETELFSFGINTAVLLRDRELINYFCGLKDSVQLSEDQKYSVELFYRLLNLKEIPADFLEKFNPVKFNPAIIAALSGYDSKLRIRFLVKIISEFPENMAMKKILADELKLNGMPAESLELHYEILGKTKNLPVLLDTIALLSELEKFDELEQLIDNSENDLKDYPDILSKLREIKKKISEQA